MNTDVILELKGISKAFPGVKALDGVDLTVKKGSAHALIGENGAGKSTLMNIITGTYTPDEGEILFDGQKVRFHSTRDSRDAGIGLVHQEDSLLPYMDVRSNLFLGRFPSRLGFVNHRELSRRTDVFLRDMGIYTIKPERLVANLSMAERKMVEIGKALTVKPKLLLLDEPTAPLTENEVELLFDIIRRQQALGVGIIYITHRLEEVFDICDTVTIFRDGRHVVTDAAAKFDFDGLISNMVGRSLNEQMGALMQNRADVVKDEIVLQADNLRVKGRIEDVSFALRRGEVLGLAGLTGAGRSSVLEALFGYAPLDSGVIRINGKPVGVTSARLAIKNKIGFIPEDRKNKGLSLIADVRENINIATMRANSGRFLLSEKKQNEAAEEYRKKLNIRTPSIRKVVGQLSGGNQQKVILARWLKTNPEILLLDEPTHGIDVGAKMEVYKIIEELTRQGISVILASSEMTELMLLCDRIAVMYNGKITGFVDRGAAGEDVILTLASGEARK